MTETKYCRTCARDLPRSSFGIRNKQRGWIQSKYVECTAEYHQRWYASNRADKLKKNAEWAAANPEKVKELRRRAYRRNPEKFIAATRSWQARHPEKVKAWTEANPEAVRARTQRYYAKHKETKAAERAKWAAANPERAREQVRRRQARLAKAPGGPFANWRPDYQARIDLFERKCSYCLVGPYETLDHEVPLSRGGTNAAENIRPACRRCNSSKGPKVYGSEWVGRYDVLVQTALLTRFGAPPDGFLGPDVSVDPQITSTAHMAFTEVPCPT